MKHRFESSEFIVCDAKRDHLMQIFLDRVLRAFTHAHTHTYITRHIHMRVHKVYKYTEYLKEYGNQ
jgi:hypothetical protein